MGGQFSKSDVQPQSDAENIIKKEKKFSSSNLKLFWLDSSPVDLLPPDVRTVYDQLSDSLNNRLEFFDDECECYGRIREMRLTDKILVIISAGSLAAYLVPRIYRLCQVISIFIYYSSENDLQQKTMFEWNESQIKWISLNELAKRIESFQARWHRSCVTEHLSIEIFKLNDRKQDHSSTSINGTFLFSQLLIDTLIQLPSQPTDMNEFVDICAKEFMNNEKNSNDLHSFSNDYKPSEALRWYTKPIFLYSLLNKALRVQNIELLFLLRFFIRDIQYELAKNQCQKSVVVYRGQLMSRKEVDLLQNSIGNLISMNSFVSTSLDRQKAEFYIEGAVLTDSNENDQYLLPVLFVIEADPNRDRPFADITQFSEFPEEEQEVLFMVGIVYRLRAVWKENDKFIVSMQSCDAIGDEMKTLLNYMKITRIELGENKTNLLTFIDLLSDMHKIDSMERFVRRVLREISIAAKSNPINLIQIAKCHFHLGHIARERNQYNKARQEFDNALHCINLVEGPNSLARAAVYASIAILFDQQAHYKRAIHYHAMAVDVLQENNGNEVHLARLYLAMGSSYRHRKRYVEARYWFEKALTIKNAYLPAAHYEFAAIYKALAAIHFDFNEFDQALDNCQHALDIEIKSLPLDHPSLAVTYEYMSTIYERLGDFDRARDCLSKSNAIDHRTTLVSPPLSDKIYYTCSRCYRRVWMDKIFYELFQPQICFYCMSKPIDFPQ